MVDEQLSKHYHWAHRQGWALGGAQQKENLDPTTAGSNYDTLFKVEAPIAYLLIEKQYKEVKVSGEVEFKPDSAVPHCINYRIDCGKEESITVVIDPLIQRRPTFAEFSIAKQFYELNHGLEEKGVSCSF